MILRCVITVGVLAEGWIELSPARTSACHWREPRDLNFESCCSRPFLPLPCITGDAISSDLRCCCYLVTLIRPVHLVGLYR